MVSILEPLRETHRTHSSTKQPCDYTTTTTYADRLESYYVMLAGSSKMPLWGDNDRKVVYIVGKALRSNSTR